MNVNLLLTGDFHLTDNPLDGYRWDVFKHIRNLVCEHEIDRVIILGDITDRKDRHPAGLVNRLVEELESLDSMPTYIDILMGNHDMPLKGDPFWKFLSKSRVRYITKPYLLQYPAYHLKFWLLPFSLDPAKDWKDVDWADTTAIFMHQTVLGSKIDADYHRTITEEPYPMPDLPRIPIFSGDVHVPQVLPPTTRRGALTYIGPPHPVTFNETWENQITILKIEAGGWLTSVEHWVTPSIKRAILDITCPGDLTKWYTTYKKEDQLKIRCKLTPETLVAWPETEDFIRWWAEAQGVTLVSVEAAFEETTPEFLKDSVLPESPAMIMKQYCTEQKLPEELATFGEEIVKKVCST